MLSQGMYGVGRAVLVVCALMCLGACGKPAAEAPAKPKPDLENPRSRAGQLIKEAKDAKKTVDGRGDQVKEDLKKNGQ